MRLLSFTSALMVLLTGVALAQSASGNSDSVLARLSYQSGTTVIDWRYEKGSPHICLAVYRSGYYQISRFTERGTQTLEGAMAKEQLGELKGLLYEVGLQFEGGGIQYLEGVESLV